MLLKLKGFLIKPFILPRDRKWIIKHLRKDFSLWWERITLPIYAIRIKELRKERKMSQDQLGKAIRKTRSAIALYESGKREPPYDGLEHLADILDASVDYIMGRTDNRFSQIDLKDWNKDDVELVRILSHLDSEDRKRIEILIRSFRKEVDEGIIDKELGEVKLNAKRKQGSRR